MRRPVAILAALSLLASSGAGAAAGTRGGPPQIPNVPGKWSHVEMNVTIKKVPHTLILDKGKIRQASSTQVVLHRADGTDVTVPLAPSTIITFGRFTVGTSALKKGEYAVTMAVDGGAAVRVKVSLRP